MTRIQAKKKILVAVDGSPQSRAALEWGQHWGKIGGHNVRAVTVVPPRTGVPALGSTPLIEAIHRNAERMMREIADESTAAGGNLSIGVLESLDVAGGLLKEADRWGADLVVVGARGLSPIKTFFLGSISQRVSRHSRRSVLIVRRAPPGKLKIVLAVDGSPSGTAAMEFLRDLGIPPRSSVEVLHVVSTLFDVWGPEFGVPGGAFPRAVDNNARAALRERGRRVLAEAVETLRADGTAAKSILREGFPAQELIQAVKKNRADLLVVGARGLSKLDRFLLGSVSQKVSAYAESSVLIVHEGGR